MTTNNFTDNYSEDSLLFTSKTKLNNKSLDNYFDSVEELEINGKKYRIRKLKEKINIDNMISRKFIHEKFYENDNIINKKVIKFNDNILKKDIIITKLRNKIDKIKNFKKNMNTDGEFDKFITKIPKTELHLHLEGFMDKELYKGIKGSERQNGPPFDLFNANFNLLANNFNINIDQLIKKMFENRYDNNIFYTQLQYSALKFFNSSKNITIKDQFDTIINSIKNIKKKDPKYKNIFIDFILDIPRSNPYDIKIINSIRSYFGTIKNLIINNNTKDYKNYIRGVGIGGRYENVNTKINSSYYKNFYDGLLKENINIIPHAGEFGNNSETCDSIEGALEYTNRIGHGVRILNCNFMTKKSKLKPYDIFLDISITSNLTFITDIIYTINNHPIYDLYKNKYKITLSTDDPGILYENSKPITLLSEYKKYYVILKNKKLDELIIYKIILNTVLNGFDAINLGFYVDPEYEREFYSNYFKKIKEIEGIIDAYFL